MSKVKRIFKITAIIGMFAMFLSLSGMGHQTNFTANWIYAHAVRVVTNATGHGSHTASQRGE